MQEIRDDNNKLFCKHDIEKHVVEIVRNGIKMTLDTITGKVIFEPVKA